MYIEHPYWWRTYPRPQTIYDWFFDYPRYQWRIETYLADNRNKEEKILDEMEQSKTPEVKKLAKELKKKTREEEIAGLKEKIAKDEKRLSVLMRQKKDEQDKLKKNQNETAKQKSQR